MLSLSRLQLIPETLLIFVLQASVLVAQNSQLPLGQATSLSTKTLPNPPAFSIPKSSLPLTISVALCSVPAANGSRFFATNNSAIDFPGPDGGTNVYEILVGSEGFGNITLDGLSNGGVFRVDIGSGQQTFEVGVSDDGPLHVYLPTLPLLADTTSNQALLFSPPFSPPENTSPSFPNYTLPPANLSFPSPPNVTSTPNFTLVLGPTSSFPIFNLSSSSNVGGLPVTSCALDNVSNIQGLIPASNMNSSLVLRDQDGWRAQFLVQGLQAHTNYTAYVIEDETRVSGPINLVTKSASFSCPLVHSLPYCPLISYAVPLSSPPFPLTAYDATTLPSSLTTPLISYLTNFTTTLLTFACGRDWYSPLQSCASCQAAYRTWLCAVSFPRCGEAPPVSTSTLGVAPQTQTVFPALTPQPNNTSPRNPNLPVFSGSYDALLPCLEICNAVDRACPNFLGFACPVPSFNANESYGVGFIDGGSDWTQGGGSTGVAQDRWGNIWCAL